MTVPQGQNTTHWLLLRCLILLNVRIFVWHSTTLYLYVSVCVCVDFCLCVHVCLSVCVWVCVFYFLDWSVGALLFSKLVTYFKASNWHDSAPTALRVTCGFMKACIWNSGKMLSRSRQNKTGIQPVWVLQSHRHVPRHFRPAGWKNPISQSTGLMNYKGVVIVCLHLNGTSLKSWSLLWWFCPVELSC